ncbi:DUF389 domain-containing protein [Geoalkalibacter halelectricus]|uniref:DUF389 domain-containing protein n=1 Tax=Geoalkalibacter halelectricus TaxID=2847045 RepID=A0ABY5ZMV1_9BACT|nr:DUF389 domain-containing protein [Geoalkalibacter halelectricus]MDO3380078.1 DUF389 domain-containing protein [Geoalkalibacter halelectricus]UWZ80403.1 DUF389 domain-containing protein [Geoalkalibacter halelectricus]
MSSSLMLLYDPAREQEALEKVVPLFAHHELQTYPYVLKNIPDWGEEHKVLTYLGDEDLVEILPVAAERGWHLGLLPHPDMEHARVGYGVAEKLADAAEDILAEPPERQVDLLYCNGRPVLRSVVLGEVFSLRPAAEVEALSVRFLSFWQRLRKLGKLRPQRYEILTQQENQLNTAALGMVAVEHSGNSVLAKSLLPDTKINDGHLHLLVLAPRSLMEMLRFFLGALFFANRKHNRLAPFIGHIRTAWLKISSDQPMEYIHDEAWLSCQELVFEVASRVLRLIPGRNLDIDDAGQREKEVFRVQALPAGEATRELIAKPLPILSHAATEEFRDLYEHLWDNARPASHYLTLTVLSALLATIGLFADSSPVIIGAMILAPTMAPIISLSMAVARQDIALLGASLRTLGIGIALAMGFAAVVGWLMPLREVTTEIAARLSPTLLDLGVAVISGIAGAYAHAREHVAKSLAGVAIAVALVPPLAVAGIGIGWMDPEVLWGALLLFLTNLSGIVLMGSLTFLVLGFAPFRRARRGLLISLLLVGLVCIPLGLGFARMQEEQAIIRALEGMEVKQVLIRDVRVRRGEPLYLSMRLISTTSVDDASMEDIKHAIEERIGRRAVVEAAIGVRR